MDRIDLEQWKGREVARLLALVETERRYYQEIVAAIPIGLAVVARDGVIESANRAFRQLFGLKPEEVYRRNIAQLIASPDLVDALKAGPRRSVYPPPMVIELEERTLRVSLISVREWDDDTEFEALLVAENLTGVSNRAAMREVPAMIWTADARSLEFSVVAGDSAGIAHPGFASTQIHPDDRDRVVEFYRWALETAGSHACEYRAYTADQKVVWYRDSFKVNPHAEGKPAKAAGVVTDVTERKQMEQISEQASRLDALAGLSKSLTHELNNSLMVVTGYGEDLLGNLPELDPKRNDVQEILGAANRMSDLTGHLLTFTRRQAEHGAPVEVSEVVARSAGVAEVELSVPPQFQVMADEAQLESALRAILQRLGHEGKVGVEARATVLNEQTGSGLAHGRYIELTFRTSKPASLNFGALLAGRDPLGPELARAHALITEWGGGLWQSAEELHVLLPAAEDLPPPAVKPPPSTAAAVETAADAHVAAPVEAETPAEPEPRLETILIVEDEGGIRALVRKILRRQNYDVLEAGSADEALEVVAAFKGHIDLLITDMSLPQQNGRQLAEELKQTRSDLKVLYVSGYTDDPAIYDRELPAGAAFLQKPFTLGSLLSKVREVLDAKSAG